MTGAGVIQHKQYKIMKMVYRISTSRFANNPCVCTRDSAEKVTSEVRLEEKRSEHPTVKLSIILIRAILLDFKRWDLRIPTSRSPGSARTCTEDPTTSGRARNIVIIKVNLEIYKQTSIYTTYTSRFVTVCKPEIISKSFIIYFSENLNRSSIFLLPECLSLNWI